METSPQVKVEISKPQTLILYFDYNKAELKTSPQEDQQYSLIQDWMASHPDSFLDITGYADSKGSSSYNNSLAMKRALNTENYLKSKGLSSEKMKTVAKGEENPVADNGNEEGRAKNRRVEISIN